MQNSGEVIFNRTYTFKENDLVNDSNDTNEFEDDEPLKFIFADRNGNYFKIRNHILSINLSVYIQKDIILHHKYFVALNNVSIFRKIENIISEDIYIGGDSENAISESDLIALIKNFPNTYEVKKYINARLGAVLINYFNSSKDTERSYQKYMNKKVSQCGKNLLNEFKETELIKFKSILQKLKGMLKDEPSYNEHQWQIEISEIILLLNSKYIRHPSYPS